MKNDLETRIKLMGYRGIDGDSTLEERKALAKSAVHRSFLEGCLDLARGRLQWLKDLSTATGRENAKIQGRAVNGLGEHQARIPLEVVLHMQVKYGQDCWGDPDFTEAFLRDNPQFRIRTTHGTRGQEYAGRNGTARASY